MSDKGKARKLEDRTKPVRSLPTMGGPGMVPHHNYPLSSDNFHSTGGRLAYRPGLGPMMGQSLPMGPSLARVPSGLSNEYDLGPPIFMPSLNLGPKPPGSGTVPAPPPSSLSNSKLAAGMSSSAPTAFMPADMLTYHTSQPGTPPLPAFHSNPLSAPHGPPYMGPSHSSATPLKISTSTIAKPTPISMPHGSKGGPLTKVGPSTQLDKDGAFTSTAGGKPLKGSPQGGVVKFLGTSEGGVKGDGLVLSQSYYSTSVSVLSSPSNSSLSKILMAPSPPSTTSSSSSSSSSSSACSTTQDSQQPMAASSPGSKPLSTAVGGFSAVLTDAYPVRSPGLAPAIPATSGQPSSNVSFADTRLDRPPQPSAPHLPAGGVAPGKELTQQGQGQGKDRMTTAEVASNIIISNPGLTGKHIAAMTNSTLSQPSPLLPHSSYSSPIISQPGISSPELLPPGHAPLLLNQHMVDPAWGFPPQHNSNHMFHNALSSPVSMATTGLGGGAGGGGGQELSTTTAGLKSRLDCPLPQSPLQGAGGGGASGPGGGAEQGVPSSPSQAMRPRILRGKRSVDGNWKQDGPLTNSLQNSPGSPHRTKLPSNLKKAVLASPAAVSASSGEQAPPTSPGMDGPHPFNHVGGVARMEDTTGSPRKKPRKQNVVATDDQYASNVPDTAHQQQPLPLAQPHTPEEVALLSPDHPKGKGGGAGGMAGEGGGSGKEVGIRYLAQLRQSPFPINGVYKLRHNTAHNHFRSPADIKHRESLPTSVYDLANAKSSQDRASGWKLFRFNAQLEEVSQVESDCLALVEEIQQSLDTLAGSDSGCQLDAEALRTTRELVQGNVDRSNRVLAHVESTRTNMFMVLEHKSQVLDVLDKYSNFKWYYSSISPSLSSSSSNQHKSHS